MPVPRSVIAAGLGLSEDASEAQVLAALQSRRGGSSAGVSPAAPAAATFQQRVAVALGLPTGASMQQVLAALSTSSRPGRSAEESAYDRVYPKAGQASALSPTEEANYRKLYG